MSRYLSVIWLSAGIAEGAFILWRRFEETELTPSIMYAFIRHLRPNTKKSRFSCFSVVYQLQKKHFKRKLLAYFVNDILNPLYNSLMLQEIIAENLQEVFLAFLNNIFIVIYLYSYFTVTATIINVSLEHIFGSCNVIIYNLY